jgi:uncharacterized protein (DUF1800 family)
MAPAALRASPHASWTRAEAAHLLRRAGFGGTPDQIDQLLALGRDGAVDLLVDYEKVPANFTAYPEANEAGMADRRLMRQLNDEQRRGVRQLYNQNRYQHMAALREWWVTQMAATSRPLQEKMVLFWHGHFTSGFREVRSWKFLYLQNQFFREHALDRFEPILLGISRDPAMLRYLDNAGNNRRKPNENYARELMELHTLGVDAGYTQTDVVELARILTGWTIDQPRAGGAFLFRPAMHDTGTKTLLGSTFGSAGEVEGTHALDLLARHPATARHIAFKLAQRFVADEPPPALVARTAAVFTSTDGDLREVVRSILMSPEFLGPEFHHAKVKTPLEFVVSALRATGATMTTAQPVVAALQNMGMPLYGCQPPTGYSMTADAWVNTGALLNRMNFATALVDGGRRGAGANRGPIQMDVRTLAPDVSEGSRTRLVGMLLAGGVSDTTAQTLARAETPQQLIALTLGSPEFQRR